MNNETPTSRRTRPPVAPETKLQKFLTRRSLAQLRLQAVARSLKLVGFTLTKEGIENLRRSLEDAILECEKCEETFIRLQDNL